MPNLSHAFLNGIQRTARFDQGTDLIDSYDKEEKVRCCINTYFNIGDRVNFKGQFEPYDLGKYYRHGIYKGKEYCFDINHCRRSGFVAIDAADIGLLHKIGDKWNTQIT